MSHPLELRMILSSLIFYNFRGTFSFFLSYYFCLFFWFIFIVLDLSVLYYLLPQILIKWGIGRAMGGGSIFWQFSGEKARLHCLFS